MGDSLTDSTPVPPRIGGRVLALAFSIAGLLWSAVRLLDPTMSRGAVAAPALALVGAALALAGRTSRRGPLLASCVAILFCIQARVQPEFRADSAGYYAYVRSVVFDHDLNFANEWERWRIRAPSSEKCRRRRRAAGRTPLPSAAPSSGAHSFSWLTSTSSASVSSDGRITRRTVTPTRTSAPPPWAVDVGGPGDCPADEHARAET